MFASQVVMFGILNGGLYAIVAIGFSMGITVARIVNFFHTDLVIFAAYIVFWLYLALNISPFLLIAISTLILFSLSVAMYKFPLLKANEKAQTMHMIGPAVLTAFGISLIIQNVMINFWGADARIIKVEFGSFDLYGIKIPLVRLITTFSAILLLTVIWLFLRFNRFVKAIRAIAQDPRAAQTVGINTYRLNMLCFALASATAGVAGGLIGMIYPFSPESGLRYLNLSATLVILGGLSIIGTLIAGLLLGVAEAFITCLLGAELKDLLATMLFIIVVSVRRAFGE
jgi:branched-chain amino acid transport system permease protein